MQELQDYSGEFRPDITMHDFSKDTLVKAWQAASKLFAGMDGIWCHIIRERFGQEMACELEIEAWKRCNPLEVRWTAEAMNIQGDDVAALFKVLQTYAGTGGILDLEFDLKNRNHGIMTVRRCPGVAYNEKHGETELQKNACEVIDMGCFERLGHLINPKIKMTCLNLPTRERRDDLACQWEWHLEE